MQCSAVQLWLQLQACNEVLARPQRPKEQGYSCAMTELGLPTAGIIGLSTAGILNLLTA